MRMTNRRRHQSVAFLGLTLACTAGGQQAAAQDMPSGREVVDRYLEAVGGEEAMRESRSWKATGGFAMPSAGLGGTLEAYQAPNRMFARINVPGIGELLRGYDGSVAWSLNPLEGPRILEGKEAAQTVEEASPGAALRDATVVTSLETLERATMNGEECWRVKVTWKSGRETFDCYSVASGLMVATTGKAETNMGAIDYTTTVHDYKQFGPLLMPTRVVQQLLGQEQVVTTESIEFGPVDTSLFELPPQIAALVRN